MRQFTIFVLVFLLITSTSVAGDYSAVQSFDVDRATAAYLAGILPADVAKADGYVNTGYLTTLLYVILDMVIALVFLRFCWSKKWRDWAERRCK